MYCCRECVFILYLNIYTELQPSFCSKMYAQQLPNNPCRRKISRMLKHFVPGSLGVHVSMRHYYYYYYYYYHVNSVLTIT